MKFGILFVLLSMTGAWAQHDGHVSEKLERLHPDSVAVSKELIQINKGFIRDIASEIDEAKAKRTNNGEIPFWFTTEEK